MPEWKEDKPIKRNVNTVLVNRVDKTTGTPYVAEKVIDFEWHGAD